MTKRFLIGNFQLAIRIDRRPKRGQKSLSLSRFLRVILERKWVKNAFGINLAVAVLFTNLNGQPTSAFSLRPTPEITWVSPMIVGLTTGRSAQIPTGSSVVNQRFSLLHRGIDLDGNIGAPIYPAIEGIVAKTSRSYFSYGNHVIINHGNGFASLYAHLSKILVKESDQVDKNTVIGLIGNSGWATGSHLHFEVWDNGRQINPADILPLN